MGELVSTKATRFVNLVSNQRGVIGSAHCPKTSSGRAAGCDPLPEPKISMPAGD